MFRLFLEAIINWVAHLWSEVPYEKDKRKRVCEDLVLIYDMKNKNLAEILMIIKQNHDKLYENDISCRDCFDHFYLPRLKFEFAHLSKEEFDEKYFAEYYMLKQIWFPHHPKWW